MWKRCVFPIPLPHKKAEKGILNDIGSRFPIIQSAKGVVIEFTRIAAEQTIEIGHTG